MPSNTYKGNLYRYDIISVICDNIDESRSLQTYLFSKGFNWNMNGQGSATIHLPDYDDDYPICYHIYLKTKGITQLTTEDYQDYNESIDYIKEFNNDWDLNYNKSVDENLIYFHNKNNSYKRIIELCKLEPTYEHRRIIKESVKYKFNQIIILANNKDECMKIEDLLHDCGFNWRSNEIHPPFLYNQNSPFFYPFPKCIMVNLYFHELGHNEMDDFIISELHREDTDSTLYTIDDYNTIESILIFGKKPPTYKPRTIIRESKLYEYKYDEIVYKANSKDDAKIVLDILSAAGFSKNGANHIFNLIGNSFVSLDLYINLHHKTISWNTNRSYSKTMEDIVEYNNRQGDNIEPFVYDENTIKEFISIINTGRKTPTYEPRRIIRENKHVEKYDVVIIRFDSSEDFENFKNNINVDLRYNDISEFGSNDRYRYAFVLISDKADRIYGTLSNNTLYSSSSNSFRETITLLKSQNLKVTDIYDSVQDINIIRDIIKHGIIKPNYSPKKIIREKMHTSFNKYMILEKSSLTNLGIPREVMQPIQTDFAIPYDAKWDKINLKKDVINILREGDKELIIQIAMDSIKVFISYKNGSSKSYAIDRYILDEDAGWSGEYIKSKRDIVSMTQLFSEIEANTMLYHLRSDFSILKQPKRRLMKTNIEFKDFNDKFKKDFIKNFNNILKRIVGKNYKDAKGEISDKAKQIEIENNMMISGLDNPIEGPNGLTILDQFLIQFEDAYSQYFEEHLNIKELSDYFTRDKVMTSFMYFIYTGKILET